MVFERGLDKPIGDIDLPIDRGSKLVDLVLDSAGIPADTWDEEDGKGFSRDHWVDEIWNAQLDKDSPETIWDWLVSEGARLTAESASQR